MTFPSFLSLFQSVHSNSFGNISAIYHLLVDKLERQDLKRSAQSSGGTPLVAAQRKASITTGTDCVTSFQCPKLQSVLQKFCDDLEFLIDLIFIII
jgi:hypothetical protein